MTGEEDEESDVDVFERVDPTEVEPVETALVTLPPADLLDIERADALLRWRSAKIISVIGERNGGKTTLVSELYERFLRGPFAGFFFCHSLSLLGFEQKSFWSRAISRADIPDTPRTSARDGVRFFHLALSKGGSQPRADLLISERAGEAYRDARDTPSLAKDLIEIRKADIIVLILDGARVAKALERAEAFAAVRNIVQALRDSSAANRNARIQLVTTKEDLLDGPEQDKSRTALDTFEQSFIAAFSPSFAQVTTLRVAARDPTSRIAPGTGLAPLLQSWLEPKLDPPAAHFALSTLEDEFDRLLLRRES